MRNLAKSLFVWIILLNISYTAQCANATKSTIEEINSITSKETIKNNTSPEAPQALTQEVQEFENLAEATLNAKKLTVSGHFATHLARSMVYILTALATVKIVDWRLARKKDVNCWVIGVINLLIPLISELIIHKKILIQRLLHYKNSKNT